MKVPHSWLSTSQRPRLLILSLLGVKISTYKFGLTHAHHSSWTAGLELQTAQTFSLLGMGTSFLPGTALPPSPMLYLFIKKWLPSSELGFYGLCHFSPAKVLYCSSFRKVSVSLCPLLLRAPMGSDYSVLALVTPWDLTVIMVASLWTLIRLATGVSTRTMLYLRRLRTAAREVPKRDGLPPLTGVAQTHCCVFSLSADMGQSCLCFSQEGMVPVNHRLIFPWNINHYIFLFCTLNVGNVK